MLGCAASGPRLAPAVDDYERYVAEASALEPADLAADLLTSAQSEREAARALSAKGGKKEASFAMARAVADARAALAEAQAEDAMEAAAGCRRDARAAVERWEKAQRQLLETEQFAGRAAGEIPRVESSPGALDVPRMPLMYAPEKSAMVFYRDIQQAWTEWSEVARAQKVPIRDLEDRYQRAWQPADTSKVGPAADLQKHRALRLVQELQARVRREVSDPVCERASRLTLEAGAAEGAALREILELERGLKENLRGELEQMRSTAKTREDELFQAMQQLEGEFARITRDARGTIVSLADILFDFDRATLKRNVEFSLVRVATILNQFPEMHIAVEGHTDSVGRASYNQQLSEKRATAVYEFLASQGVAPERMVVAGYGDTRPVADNETAEGRQRNRRVDLVIQE